MRGAFARRFGRWLLMATTIAILQSALVADDGSDWTTRLHSSSAPKGAERVRLFGEYSGPKVTAYGTAVDEDDQPVAGALVLLRENARHGRRTGHDIVATTTTNERGEFRFWEVATPEHDDWLGVTPRWDVVSVAAGRAIAFEHLTRVTMDRPFRLRMAPERRVSGVVVDANAMPIADATLHVAAIWAADMPADEHANLPGFLKLVYSKIAITGPTDGDGRFAISGLPAESRLIVSTSAGNFLGSRFFVTTTDNAPARFNNQDILRSPVRVVLKRLGRRVRVASVPKEKADEPPLRLLSVRVVDADTKKPLPASAIVYTSPKQGGYGLRDWPSKGVGIFEVSTRETIFGLEAVGPLAGYFLPGRGLTTGLDHAGPYITVKLEPQELRKEIVFKIHRGLTVNGVLQDQHGKRVVGATVGLSHEGHLAMRKGQRTYETKTDGRGAFTVRGLDPYNSNYLRAFHAGMRLKRRFIIKPPNGDAPAKETHTTVTLHPTAKIFGALTKDGKPLTNPQRVTLHRKSEPVLGFDRCEVDRNGRFEFPFVEALPEAAGEVEYTLRVECILERRTRSVTFSVSSGRQLDLETIEFFD